MKLLPATLFIFAFCQAAYAAPRQTVDVCTPQSIKIKGSWQCFTTTSRGESSGQVYTFSQSGNKFFSTGETSHRLFGTIEGSAIEISEVVNGEELEGYVKRSSGHIISIKGKTNNGIVTVYRDSQAGLGSFNCQKQ